MDSYTVAHPWRNDIWPPHTTVNFCKVIYLKEHVEHCAYIYLMIQFYCLCNSTLIIEMSLDVWMVRRIGVITFELSGKVTCYSYIIITFSEK